MRTPKRKKNQYRPSGSIFDLTDPARPGGSSNGDLPDQGRQTKKPKIRRAKPLAPSEREVVNLEEPADTDRPNIDKSSKGEATEQAMRRMNSACADALVACGDIKVVAHELFMFIGLAMNGLGQAPAELGSYLIEQGRALKHPKALEEGEHLSAIAYLSQVRGLVPDFDELHELRQCALVGSTPTRPRRSLARNKR